MGGFDSRLSTRFKLTLSYSCLTILAMKNPNILYPDLPKNRWLLLPTNYQQPGKQDFDHVGDHTFDMFSGRNNVLIVTDAKTAIEGQAAAMERIETGLRRYGAASFLHAHQMTPDALRRAAENDIQGIFVGGGNTFRLVKSLHDPRTSLGDHITRMVAEGRPYHGTSAGQQAMADDIRTCADERSVVTYTDGKPTIMIEGLNIVQGNLNLHPHYLEKGAGGPSIGGGSYEELQNYAIEDPKRTILGIRNGAALYIRGAKMSVVGEGDGVDIITANRPVRMAPPKTDISFLI